MQEFFLYILKCSDGSYYAGHTDNVEHRLSQHKAGSFPDGYTASRLPVELVFTEKFSSRDDAFAMERRIKGWSRKKKEALIQENFALLKCYAKKIFAEK